MKVVMTDDDYKREIADCSNCLVGALHARLLSHWPQLAAAHPCGRRGEERAVFCSGVLDPVAMRVYGCVVSGTVPSRPCGLAPLPPTPSS